MTPIHKLFHDQHITEEIKQMTREELETAYLLECNTASYYYTLYAERKQREEEGKKTRLRIIFTN